MALTFKTAELLATIEGVQQSIIAADQRYEAAKTQARTDARNKWWNSHREDVRALRDYLTRSLKNDTPPLTVEAKQLMHQRDGYSNDDVRLFHGAGDSGISRPSIGYQRPDQLDGLAALLRAHVGDTVTAYQLKELGVHPRDLEKLFRAAAVAGAKVAGK